ncbi:MAG: hypothetical protein ABIT01_17755 [Thermoanaerobaculia bacterium]
MRRLELAECFNRIVRPCLGLIITFFCWTPLTAHAGKGVWSSGGPFAGVYALVIDPATPTKLYAGGSDGVFKSTDAGVRWNAASMGLPSRSVSILVIDPTTPSTLYAAIYEGVFTSTDSGGTWWPANTGLRTFAIDALAIDPKTPTTLYAGAYSTSADEGGLFKSTNSGHSWTRTGLRLDFVALCIDPTSPAILYAATSPQTPQIPYPTGIFKSTDAGSTWSAANTGLLDKYVFSLAIDSRTPTTLYAGTELGGVFKSTDSGGTWAPANAGLNQFVVALTIDPVSPATLYAVTGNPGEPLGGQVFKSTDAGTTWLSTGLAHSFVLAVDPSSPATVFAGTESGGIYKSRNSGGAWVASSTGLTRVGIQALAIDARGPTTLYGAGVTSGGILKSTDAGSSWVRANSGVWSGGVTSIAIDPASPSTVYAGTLSAGVFRSSDAGGRWSQASTGLATVSVSALAIDPRNPSTLYAGTAYAIVARGVFKSTDSGDTWLPTGLNSGNISTLKIDPVNPATIYAGMRAGVQKSTDAGMTWANASAGLTVLFVTDVAIDPRNHTTLYLGSEIGVFRSTDSGEHWIARGPYPSNPPIHSLAVDAGNGDVFYAGDDGVFRSTDAGATWSEVKPGLPRFFVSTLALDPSGKTVYAGLSGGGVWQFTDGPTSSTLIPSSARAAGLGGTIYTTDLTVANAGSEPTAIVLTFLGHDVDGRSGREESFALPEGVSMTFPDVLGSVFGLGSGYGAIRITSASDSVHAIAQTSTPGFGGTFGQSVPAARTEDLITAGAPRTILGVREDASFRTNLVLANATDQLLEVDVSFRGGATAGALKRISLPPFGMTQINRVVRELGNALPVAGLLEVSTTTPGGAFAAYASVIDNATNDPRTLLPIKPIGSGVASPQDWFLPSSAHVQGAGGAFYTTDLITYSNVDMRYTFKFLGHDVDGRPGLVSTFDLSPNVFASYANILGSLPLSSADYGALRITTQYPSTESTFVGFLAQTSTPGFGGTFGQSVPVIPSAELIRTGASRSILAIREDDSYRTNLILTNATEAPLVVDVHLLSPAGLVLATRSYALPPLGMTQATRVVRDMGISFNVNGARLVLSTPTPNGAFASYASIIDNVTNDPRTLLPR